MGEVYNLGGGRRNSLSILETIDILADMGFRLNYTYSDQARTGDHICYISSLEKLHTHFPGWKMQYSVQAIVEEIAGRHLSLAQAGKS
jgi:CDP-paratose 2-epimerase